MFKSLFTLSTQYINKKIVIYGINRDSVMVFSRLALNYQTDVRYFWNPDGRFIGDLFVNRMIISTEQLNHIGDIVVIIPEVIKKEEAVQYTKNKNIVFYIDDLLDINNELKHKNSYIYGIGTLGGKVYDKMLEKNMTIKGVCVTKTDGVTNWRGHKVVSVEQIEYGDQYAIIVATEKEQFQTEMLEKLENHTIEKYIACFMGYWTIYQGNFFQVINLALIKHKNIWVYVCKNEIELYLDEIFRRYQINIFGKINETEIYDLGYENIDDVCVVVAEKDESTVIKVCDILDSIGLGLEKWNYTAIGHYTFTNKTASKLSQKDVLIGDSIYENKKYPGYIVYGDEKTARVKIMILGGSTSTDRIYRTVSWVKFLYKKLCDVGCKPLIFNGAVCGHGIVDEFLHMIRDIEPLKPDLVISFSGVNNTYNRETKNLFNIRYADQVIKDSDYYISGVESNESLYDFWYRISKFMKLIANAHGAIMYNFLQPMSMAKDDLSLTETGMFDFTRHTEYVRFFKFRASVEKDLFYTNMISFLESSTAYIDYIHYSTESNKLIADYIFEVIEKDIKEVKCFFIEEDAIN